MTYILSMFNTGQVTLPKKWRSQFNTTKFVAKPHKDGLLIQPLEKVYPGMEESNMIYEEVGDEMSLTFKKPVKASVFADHLRDNLANLEKDA